MLISILGVPGDAVDLLLHWPCFKISEKLLLEVPVILPYKILFPVGHERDVVSWFPQQFMHLKVSDAHDFQSWSGELYLE